MTQRVVYQRPGEQPASAWPALLSLLPGPRDVISIVGLALMAYGLALWSVPLAWVVVGAVFLYLGLWHRRSVPSDGGR